MKLSENTLDILKNFASLNQGIVIRPGNVLRTVSENKTVLAEATVEESFPNEFGIYDLHKLLSVVSSNKSSPDISFEKEYLSFTSVGKIRIRYSDISHILAPSLKKSIELPSVDVSLDFTSEIQNWIFSTASILKAPNIVVKCDGKGEDINILAMDVKGEIVDDASVKVNGKSDNAFQAVFKVENLKILPGAYKVEISSSGVGKFTNESKNVTYWIAIEKGSSKFGK
jgi:gp45 sliding clamp, C terminal